MHIYIMCSDRWKQVVVVVGGAYWWSRIVKGPHCNFEASSFCNQDILFWDSHIFKSDASGIRTSLTHVQLLQANSKKNRSFA